MYIIQPHYHGIARTAQDYERMAHSGVIAVAEPAFWAGFDREYPETFLDYFTQISDFEPTRAAQYGIQHYSWVAVNPKEAENRALSKEVCSHLPRFFKKPTVLGIGEIGLHLSTPNECATFEEQLQLSLDYNQLVLIHTPHLADKLKGTQKILEILENFPFNRNRIWVDHAEEHTIKQILAKGYWTGLTLYPQTKMTPQRAADILEIYGKEKILVNSSADWGPSDPFTLQECILECRDRGFSEKNLLEIFHNNSCYFLQQSPKWRILPISIQKKESRSKTNSSSL